MTAAQVPARRSDGVTALGYASFILIGWSALLVPALVPSIERDFTQSDAGVGVLFLASSLLFVLGSLASGYLMERLGRDLVLPVALLTLGAGLAMECLAPSWALFVIGAGISGLGSGSVEVGVNGLFLDRFHEDRGRAMNRLHLGYSVGALAAPLVVGALIEVGVAWRVPFAVTGGLVVAVALRLVTRDLGAPGVALSGPSLRGLGARRVPLPLVLLALAIGCYVASENGVSSWLVRFLGDAPVGVSTAALSVFWAGLTGGRIVASRFAGRFASIQVATACVFAAGFAIVTAVAVPWVGASITLFGVAGFACGPVYPMIMASAGGLYPERSNAVSGILTAAAVAGSVVYPPLMGFISSGVGLGVGMAGAGLIAFACAAALVGVRVFARQPEPGGGEPARGRPE